MASIEIATPTSSYEIWIIRHGERIDETDKGDQWYYGTPKPRRFDPPLTKHGAKQAQQSAQTLQHLVLTQSSNLFNESSQSIFDTIYCSPMQRCLSTAHEVAITLNQSNDSRFHCTNGIIVIPGLGECAAAGRKHGVDNLQFLTPKEMMRLCPSTIIAEENCWDEDITPRKYEPALDWIINHETSKKKLTCQNNNNAQPQRILIVAHREAIRDLTGSCSRIPYCAIAFFKTSIRSGASTNARSPSFDLLDDLGGDGMLVDVVDDDDDDVNDDPIQYDYHVQNVFDPTNASIVQLTNILR